MHMRVMRLATIIGIALVLSATPSTSGQSVAQNHAVASLGSFWQAKLRTASSVKRTALRARKNRSPLIAQVSPSVKQAVKSDTHVAAPLPLLPVVDQPDIRMADRIIANEMFRMMPSPCIAALKSFYVRYEPDAPRGLAGKENIIVRGGLPEEEFRALLVHEFGHVMDLGCFQGTPDAGETAFKDGGEMMYRNDPSIAFYEISWTASNVQKSGVKPEDFVTGYAAWDVFEDFSESLAYYVFQRSAFVERAKSNAAIAAKLRWFETYAFPGGAPMIEGLHQWSGQVPWDSTKLPYKWNAR